MHSKIVEAIVTNTPFYGWDFSAHELLTMGVLEPVSHGQRGVAVGRRKYISFQTRHPHLDPAWAWFLHPILAVGQSSLWAKECSQPSWLRGLWKSAQKMKDLRNQHQYNESWTPTCMAWWALNFRAFLCGCVLFLLDETVWYSHKNLLAGAATPLYLCPEAYRLLSVSLVSSQL